MIGVKYTGARLAAEHAVDAVVQDIGGRRRCPTAALVLPHADIADVEGRLLETARDIRVSLERDQIEHLGGWYGTEASDVLRYSEAHGLLQRLDGTVPVVAGEIAYAVDHAQAIHLSDAVLRRTPLGSAGHPGLPALEAAAAVMGQKLGWSADQRAAEVAEVVRRYPPTAPSPEPARAVATAR
jgi:glycerol-3-phosphate dehydrogenase